MPESHSHVDVGKDFDKDLFAGLPEDRPDFVKEEDSLTPEEQEKSDIRDAKIIARRLLLKSLRGTYNNERLNVIKDTIKEGEELDEETLGLIKLFPQQILSNPFALPLAFVSYDFNEFCRFFKLSYDLSSDIDLVSNLKNGLISKLKDSYCYVGDLIDIKKFFNIPLLVEDPEIIQLVTKKIFEGNFQLNDKIEVLKVWGISIDLLQEKYKKTVLNSLSLEFNHALEGRDVALYDLKECLEVWPEFRDLPEIKDLVSQRLKCWSFSFGWGASQFAGLVHFFKETIKTFDLPADLLGQWQKKVVEVIFSYNNSSLTLPKKEEILKQVQNRFRLSDAEFKELARPEIINSIFVGNFEQSVHFSKYFNLEAFTPEEIKEEAKARIKRILDDENGELGELRDIQSGSGLSADFFSQPEIFNKLMVFLGKDFLKHPNISVLKRQFENFGFSDEVFKTFDASLSSYEFRKMSAGHLGLCLRLLASEKGEELFPQTSIKVRDEFLKILPGSAEAANSLVVNFLSYRHKSWAKDAILLALNYHEAATILLSLVAKDERFSWDGEPRISVLTKKADRVISQHDIALVKEQGRQGFKEEDPYEKSPARYGYVDLWLEDNIRKVITNKENGLDSEFAGLLTPEMKKGLVEIGQKIEKNYKEFIKKFSESSFIPEVDKKALLEGGIKDVVKMNNLLPNVQSLVGRFIVQKAEGKKDFGSLREAITYTWIEVNELLSVAFDSYLKTYAIDLPLYDVLFDEFDDLRSTGRKPMEVYLGRDGIYAYIGRRAQDAIRRAKDKKRSGQRIQEKNGMVEINPKYLVYPSFFRDEISYETKKEFLEQERITQESDPVFFDTGYTGSIPEQIMQIMGFSKKEIEKRIRLLSADAPNRRLRPLGENKYDVVATVEKNPKTENTAHGLFKDPETGRIRHLATPSSLSDQFNFSLIKQAVARHFMVREGLRLDRIKNVSLDFEKRTAVVDSELVNFLPPEFLSNLEEFLSQNGEFINRINEQEEGGEGGSEIISLKLAEGMEIVAKRISPVNFFKDAHGEFVFLNVAKQAGMPVVEPIGFLAGKKEGEPSYLLTKKINGLSGKDFVKYLRSSDKFNLAQIGELLEKVAEENKKIAKMFREQMKIDKQWKIEDLMIVFNEETGVIDNVVPIDWSDISTFDPKFPKEVCRDLK